MANGLPWVLAALGRIMGDLKTQKTTKWVLCRGFEKMEKTNAYIRTDTSAKSMAYNQFDLIENVRLIHIILILQYNLIIHELKKMHILLMLYIIVIMLIRW